MVSARTNRTGARGVSRYAIGRQGLRHVSFGHATSQGDTQRARTHTYTRVHALCRTNTSKLDWKSQPTESFRDAWVYVCKQVCQYQMCVCVCLSVVELKNIKIAPLHEYSYVSASVRIRLSSDFGCRVVGDDLFFFRTKTENGRASTGGQRLAGIRAVYSRIRYPTMNTCRHDDSLSLILSISLIIQYNTVTNKY